MGNNIKSSSEIAAQIATNMTLQWNDFLTLSTEDLSMTLWIWAWLWSKEVTTLTTASRLTTLTRLTSFTANRRTPSFGDMMYAGHIKRMPIHELKRLAGDQLTEEDYKKIARQGEV